MNDTTTEVTTIQLPLTSTDRQQTTPPFTVTTTTNSSPSLDANGGGMGVAGGVAVALSVIAVITIIFVILFLWRRKKKKEKSKRPKEQPPDKNTLNKIEEELHVSQKPKKGKKNKNVNKRSVSIISNDPSSMPNVIAPEPPSDPGYANTVTTAYSQKKTNSKFDYYEKPNINNALLYSTGEGAEYYLCKNDRTSDTSKSKGTYKNQDFETSVSSADEKDYVNVPNKLPNPRDIRQSEESGEFYEPMEM